MDASPTTASEAIEQTLRLERDAIERRIARYRLFLYALILASAPLMSLGAHLQGQNSIPLAVPLVYYGVLVAYSAAVWRYTKRHGALDAVIYATIVVDMLAFALPGPVFAHFDEERAGDMAMFAAHLLAPGLLLVLFINHLRMHQRGAIFGSVVAIILLLVELISYEGLVPPIIGLALTFVFTAAIGVVGARQWRHAIETFARLQLLGRFLPPSAVERVLHQDLEDALALGGRTTTLTLIAADLRGFTKMSETLTPEEVVRQLNAYHGAMLEQIDAHGGALDKFMGDGILAVFGLGIADADLPDAGATSAVACAQAMMRALDELNAQRARAKLPALRMGIGVHTGPVVAGNIGAPGRRLEFTVIGDTVNTTARLESLTKRVHRPVLISEATLERVADPVDVDALPPMPIRGREEPLVVHALADEGAC